MVRTPRSGFSVFQVLVVMGMTTILFAMFFPAIMKARMAARRAQSHSNMRQIGIAVANHEGQKQKLPVGCDENNFSAFVQLLPFIEEEALAESIDMTKPVDDEKNAKARQTTIKIFLSPLDSRTAADDKHGATNYLFSAGTKYDMTEEVDKSDGVFLYKHQLSYQDITDGPSNTIGIVETLKGDCGTKGEDVRRQYVKLDKKALPKLDEESGVQDFKDGKNIAGDRCASWMDGRFLQTTFNGGRLPNDERPDVRCGDHGGLSGPRTFADTISVGMMDGSVRTVDVRVKKDVWRAALTRNGKETIQLPE